MQSDIEYQACSQSITFICRLMHSIV